MYVTGSLDALGKWDRERALLLTRKSPTSGTWEAVIRIPVQVKRVWGEEEWVWE